MQPNDMERFSDLELNQELYFLLNLEPLMLRNNQNKKTDQDNALQKKENPPINFCEDWASLMPLSLKYGAYVEPLAWERSSKKFRAKHMRLSPNGRMANYGMKYKSDDDNPARALVMTLIKILKLKQLAEV